MKEETKQCDVCNGNKFKYIKKMKDFTDKQNEVFGKLFTEIKKSRPRFEVQANALIEMDDNNFSRIYYDSDSHIMGSNEELNKVTERAIYLKLL